MQQPRQARLTDAAAEANAAEQLRTRRAQEIRAQETNREASLGESLVRTNELARAILGPEENAARLERLEARRGARLRGVLSAKDEASSSTGDGYAFLH
jgi:hypothetical protein